MSTSLAAKILITTTLLLPFAGCSGSGNQSANANADTAKIRSEQYREHLRTFWKSHNCDPTDSAAYEQNIVDFLYLQQNADSASRAIGWKALHEADSGKLDKTVCDYLGERDSPMHSLPLLEEYLESLIRQLPETDAERARAEYLLTNIRKNKLGTVIADLDLITASGSKTTLHTLLKKEYGNTLIVIYDPDCEACEELIENFRTSLPEGKIVVAVSVTGKVGRIPSSWLSARVADPEQLESRYYLPELPQVYHVTPDKRLVP